MAYHLFEFSFVMIYGFLFGRNTRNLTRLLGTGDSTYFLVENDMIHNLIQYLDTLSTIPEKERLEIPLLFRPDQVKKGAHFLKQGEAQEYVGFVLNGLFRCYYVDLNGNEHTKHFITNNDFVFALSALISQKPSTFFIQA